jgi:hypothetical protein
LVNPLSQNLNYTQDITLRALYDIQLHANKTSPVGTLDPTQVPLNDTNALSNSGIHADDVVQAVNSAYQGNNTDASILQLVIEFYGITFKVRIAEA